MILLVSWMKYEEIINSDKIFIQKHSGNFQLNEMVY